MILRSRKTSIYWILLDERSSWVIRASGFQSPIRNSPGFYPSILRHSGIWGAADEAVLNSVSTKKKRSRKYLYSVSAIQILYFIFSFLCFFFRVHDLLYTLRRDEIRYEQVLLFMQKSSEFTTAASYTIRTDSLTWLHHYMEYCKRRIPGFIAVVWNGSSPPPCSVASKGYLVPAKQRVERQREREGGVISLLQLSGETGRIQIRIQTTKTLDIFPSYFLFRQLQHLIISQFE